jgi:hypothetical protein
MTHYTIHLPCKAYLCKYVQTIYGQGKESNTIHIDPSTDFGDLIITKLSATIHCNTPPGEMDAKLFRMTDRILLKIPMHWMRKLPMKELTKHQIIRINRSLENMFERDLCDIVSRAHDMLGIDRQTSIECFASNHGIQLEHHITFEALKKMEYRFRSCNARHTVRKKIVRDLSCKSKAA